MADPHTTPNDPLIKRVCHIIVGESEVLIDEAWENKWKWHTDEHTIQMGGQWSVLNAARKIIEMVRMYDRN